MTTFQFFIEFDIIMYIHVVCIIMCLLLCHCTILLVDVVLSIVFQTFAFDHCFWSMDESNNKYASKLMNH